MVKGKELAKDNEMRKEAVMATESWSEHTRWRGRAGLIDNRRATQGADEHEVGDVVARGDRIEITNTPKCECFSCVSRATT
jgi:hypothetical protein